MKGRHVALQARGGKWYGDSASDIRALLARQAGEPVAVVQDAACDCGGRVFSVQIDDEYQEAAWFCQSCGAQYLFHTRRVKGYYEGDPGADTECCSCPCSETGLGSVFEIAVGVTLYGDSQNVDWVFIACRCVTCGLTGYLADWHRIGYPYPELFAHMANRQGREPERELDPKRKKKRKGKRDNKAK
jgi:hypothetical protein